MFVLDSEIKIGNYVFNQINDVEIVKDIENMSKTAVIKLPTRFTVRQTREKKLVEEAIKAGDEVTIKLSYLGKYSGQEFSGFVSRIKLKTPIEIHCENEIYLLRKKNITKSWNKTTLKEILQEIVKDTPITLYDDILSMNLDKWIIKNANGAQVLESIKKDLLLTIYFPEKNKMYVGLQQLFNNGKTVSYDLNRNIVSNDLEYRSADDRKLKIKYTYIAPDGKKTSVEEGDADGEMRTFHTSVVSSESKLRDMAKEELKNLKYDGFDGDVTSFLIPYAEPAMEAKIIDSDKPNRNGNYFIKKVTTTFGMGGARRKVTIGNKL